MVKNPIPTLMMCRILCAVLCLTGFCAPGVFAADNVFSSREAFQRELSRLGDESLDLVTTPADTEHGGLVGTLATAGAFGLVYVFDNDIRGKLQGAKSSALDRAAEGGSILGSPLLHLGVAAALYGGGALADSPRYLEMGAMLGEAAILADASTLVLKQAIGRSRPHLGNGKGSFRPFQFRSDFDAAPSMHTASSFAMASVVAARSDGLPTRLLAYAAATFVGFSRMYEDKHWASDVILGAAIGELCGRIVVNRHARGHDTTLTLVPAVSADGAVLNLTGRW
jgi:membrane-associated phospholipid phosphatase